MVGRLIRSMAGLAVGGTCHEMVETDLFPGGGGVAGGAVSIVVGYWLDVGMTIHTSCACPLKLPIDMALLARQLSMLPQEGKESVFCAWTAGRELDTERVIEQSPVRIDLYWIKPLRDQWH